MIFLVVFVESELRKIVIFSVFVFFPQVIRDPVSPDRNMDSNHWFQAVNLDLDRMRREEEEVGAGLNLDLDRMRRKEEVGAGLNLDLDRMRREEEVGAGLNREKMRLVFRSCFSSGRGNQWFHLLSLQPQPSLISTNIQGKNHSNL